MTRALLHTTGDMADLAKRLGVTDVSRGVLEALGLGVPMIAGELAFVADTVRVIDGRIEPAEIDEGEFDAVAKACRNLPGFRWHHGGRRSAVVYVGGWPFDIHAVEPRPGVEAVEPYGAGDEVLRELHAISGEVLGDRRLWLWGGGYLPQVRRIGPSVAMVAAERWAVGLARLLDLRLCDDIEPASRLVVQRDHVDPSDESRLRELYGDVRVITAEAVG